MMTLRTIPLFVALFAVACFGFINGTWHSAGLADRAIAAPVAEVAKTAVAVPKDKDRDANPARVVRMRLVERVDFPGFEPNTPLKEALDFLREKYSVPIILDEAAFEAMGVQKVGEQPVHLPKMKNVRFAAILRLLLKQIKGEQYTGGFLVRPDGLEVTGSYVVMGEIYAVERSPTERFGGQPDNENAIIDRGLYSDPIVSVEFDKKPLADVLRDLTELHGINVVLDPRAGDKAKTPIALTVNNVLADSLVRMLADMSDLRAVPVNNTYYVTTRANAEAMEAEQAKRKGQVQGVPLAPVGQPGAK